MQELKKQHGIDTKTSRPNTAEAVEQELTEQREAPHTQFWGILSLQNVSSRSLSLKNAWSKRSTAHSIA
jgi:hypothetical protein